MCVDTDDNASVTAPVLWKSKLRRFRILRRRVQQLNGRQSNTSCQPGHHAVLNTHSSIHHCEAAHDLNNIEQRPSKRARVVKTERPEPVVKAERREPVVKAEPKEPEVGRSACNMVHAEMHEGAKDELKVLVSPKNEGPSCSMTGQSTDTFHGVKMDNCVSMQLILALCGESLQQRKAPRGVKRAPPMPTPTRRKAPTKCEAEEASSSSSSKSIHQTAKDEIHRILQSQEPDELLGVRPNSDDEELSKAWKRLVLLLHPDKLQSLGKDLREQGAEALFRVHEAKEELRRRAQEARAEVPLAPKQAGAPRCSNGALGSRKYEISWRIPEKQDPLKPVEKYEIWGPRYFSEAGDPFDFVLLATLPPLQSHFVIVEEAPTQQDVMWAADRVRRPTLPISVHAVNGIGASEALTLDLPWATAFPWLQGSASVICQRCLKVMPCQGAWTQCDACGFGVHQESTFVVRCPDCHGEGLWTQNDTLQCSGCMRKFGETARRQDPCRNQWKQQQNWRHRGSNHR